MGTPAFTPNIKQASGVVLLLLGLAMYVPTVGKPSGPNADKSVDQMAAEVSHQAAYAGNFLPFKKREDELKADQGDIVRIIGDHEPGPGRGHPTVSTYDLNLRRNCKAILRNGYTLKIIGHPNDITVPAVDAAGHQFELSTRNDYISKVEDNTPLSEIPLNCQ